MKKIKWGILGPGSIAHKFADALKTLENAELHAVGSRMKENAADFADKYSIPKAYGSYEELAADKEIDIVYVATPHPFHMSNTLLCLNQGKAVLCEKPFTVNRQELDELVRCARKNGVFIMEAMWTRFLPAIVKLREVLDSGIIGEIRQLKADFCFRAPWDTESRILNPALGGGALLDVGVYTISFSYMIFRSAPLSIQSIAKIGDTGVDEQCGILLGYPDGAIASLAAAIRTTSAHDAWIYGTEGFIRIPEFWHAQRLEVYLPDKPMETIEVPFVSTGYQFEALEAMTCLQEGKLESGIMPLAESLEIMETMDRIRAQWGLTYPFE